jgi:hypothetical protein
MSHIISYKKVFFVYYKINPINSAFEPSLYKHLLSKVCMKRNGWSEAISVITDNIKNPKFITDIRYQFGGDFDEDMVDDVAELIEEEISRWLQITFE